MYWEIILEKSKNKQTLPYMLGAKKVFYPDLEIDSVENLFDDIINSENNRIYQMYFCPEIGEYVIFNNPYENYRINGIEVNNPNNGKLKLVLGISMEVLGKDFDEIKKKLSDRYSNYILKEEFTYNKRWEKFSQKDEEEILSYLK